MTLTLQSGYFYRCLCFFFDEEKTRTMLPGLVPKPPGRRIGEAQTRTPGFTWASGLRTRCGRGLAGRVSPGLEGARLSSKCLLFVLLRAKRFFLSVTFLLLPFGAIKVTFPL